MNAVEPWVHIFDPSGVRANLFLSDVHDFFPACKCAGLTGSLSALSPKEAMHRQCEFVTPPLQIIQVDKFCTLETLSIKHGIRRQCLVRI